MVSTGVGRRHPRGQRLRRQFEQSAPVACVCVCLCALFPLGDTEQVLGLNTTRSTFAILCEYCLKTFAFVVCPQCFEIVSYFDDIKL